MIVILDPKCTFSISGSYTKIHKIDKKYLPEIRTIYNLVDGRAEGSARTIGTYTEIGEYAFAEGYHTTASEYGSHAEGINTTASGYGSHAEGYDTTTSELGSHAEGSGTTASGYSSHAEGSNTIASSDTCHAEGNDTTASGICSHSEGRGTIASSDCQHVQGKYNIEDSTNTYAHIVGNGEYIARSNAHTLDWKGNAWF